MSLPHSPAFRSLLTPVLLCLSVLTSACGEEPEAACLSGSQLARTELLFGLDRADAPPISDAEWQEFVDTSATPLFSEGLTVVDAGGQYRMSTGELIKENSKLMILLHDGSATRSRDIDSLRDTYKQRFDQESVLRIDTTACVAF